MDASSVDSSDSLRKSKGWRFWFIFAALCISLLMGALDLASVSTALPVIVHDFDGADSFAWVSAAYTLGSTAILPLTGRLADIFGRRPVLLGSLVIFAIGSALSGSASSMSILIAGRAIQGVGNGGIQSLTSIVTADLVSLRERGLFNAITGATVTMACICGPFLGGAIVQKTSWRWLFYLNLPLCGIAFVVVMLFLRLKTPPVINLSRSLAAMDWFGNAIIVGSTTSCIIALTWAGVKFPWSSPQVLVPLIVGIFGLILALVYEACYATHPSIPLRIISNRTSLAGYFSALLHSIVTISAVYYLPVYFQAAKAATPLLSGFYIFPLAILSPSAVVQGIIVSKTGRYRYLIYIGWGLMLTGVGLLSILGPHSSTGVSVPLQLVAATGFGFLYAATFAVLAPLPASDNASALSFLLFVRTFSQAWGIAIGATILQNELHVRLPPAYVASFPTWQDITYTAIPTIGALAPPLQDAVRGAFAGSLAVLWRALAVVCGVGFVSVLFMRELPLPDAVDERWGIEDTAKEVHVEATIREKSTESPQVNAES